MRAFVLAEKEVDNRADIYEALIELLHEAKMDCIVETGKEKGKKLVQLVEYQE